MKKLSRILLVNWHYITHEVLDFEDITFLTGKNGAGKSTILDALQVVLLGDTAGHFFNKAANDNSKRTLRGYLWGELADDEHRTLYLRDGTFSSYIVAEFEDVAKKRKFCLGVVFDCDGNGDHRHMFFSWQDELPEFHFIRDGVPLGIGDLRKWGASHKKGKLDLYETNKRYQEIFLSHMGYLGEKFFRLFRKAVPFSPIMDVAGFISEFVCDVKHQLDIEDMRENIRHYRRMEQDLDHVKRKVGALEGITEQAENLRALDDRVRMYRYLTDRADAAETVQKLAQLDEGITAGQARVDALAAGIDGEESALAAVRKRRDAYAIERGQSDVAATQQRLHNDKERLELQFQRLKDMGERQTRVIMETSARWQAVHGELAATPGWFDRDTDTALAPCREWFAQASDAVAGAMASTPAAYDWRGRTLEQVDATACLADIGQLEQTQAHFDLATDTIRQGHQRLADTVQTWRDESGTLTVRLDNLRRGIKAYDPKVIELQHLIRDALQQVSGGAADVHIFADVLELRDTTWQRAVEGYLHTQRFYLLVAPEHFATALSVYDRFKQERRIYDVGVVDTGRILERRPERVAGSLAEEVTTDNPYARAFADYLLGRVMKCQDVQDLRRHQTAITADGMLYQGYVVRQIDPKRWDTLFIGRRAIEAELVKTERRLKALQALVETWSVREQMVRRWTRVAGWSESDIAFFRDASASLADIPSLQQALCVVLDELGGLDLSSLLVLDDKIADCDKAITGHDKAIKTMLQECGKATERFRHLVDSVRPRMEQDVEAAAVRLRDGYEPSFATAEGEPRFDQELRRLGNPSAVKANFARPLQAADNQRQSLWDKLVQLRADYNRDFQTGFDLHKPDNAAFDGELDRLVRTQLTEYEEKIRDAKERAQVQFQEDFVSKLKQNIELVEQQIGELNDALRGVTFGRDSYRFFVTANPQYDRFYRMFKDEMLLEGFSLFSQGFQERYGDVVDELFRNIVDVDETDPSAQTQLEQNLQKFTDYRTYLSFDLIVKNEEGLESRLSRSMAKKSGGETQTPFYISVLASFAQMYRVKQAGSNTLRLIVFDEAYSKMDHQRIRESIRLIRQMGLQVILSAPTEKLADISPLVDRTLIVTRIRRQTKVLTFDMKKDGKEASHA